jgi:hypothetical protein
VTHGVTGHALRVDEEQLHELVGVLAREALSSDLGLGVARDAFVVVPAGALGQV